MFDFQTIFNDSQDNVQITAQVLGARLAISLLLGVIVAIIFRLSHGRGKSDASAMAATLVLLPVLIAMVSVVIGNSAARAFSLVGALSIVRFRTIVEDTRDTAFVILAVIVGMAAGAGMMIVPLLGLPIVAVAAFVFEYYFDQKATNGNSASAEVVIRFAAGSDSSAAARTALERFAEGVNTKAASTARQGTALEVVYRLKLNQRESAAAMVAELNGIKGVQSVECKVDS